MSKARTYITVSGLLLLALLARSIDPGADPPAFFADGSQALTTDGAYVTHHARNRALLGTWDMFGFEHWPQFKCSLVSGLSFVAFKLTGVSRIVSNGVGLFLNLLGILLFLAALSKELSRRALLISALFLCTNYVLFVYGRLPFLENGLIFLSSLLFFAYIHWYHRPWGKLLVGVIGGAVVVFGKSFGACLLLGPLLFSLLREDRTRLRSMGVVIGSGAIVVLGLSWLLFDERGFLSFVWQHASGDHGFPHGFSSPAGFVESLFSVTAKSRLHEYSPVLSAAAYLSMLFMITGKDSSQTADRTGIFLTAWLVGSLVLMSPFNYLPLRYLCFLLLPMAGLAALLLDKMDSIQLSLSKSGFWWQSALLLLLNWYAAFYATVWLLKEPTPIPEFYNHVWRALPIGLVLTGIMAAVLRNRTLRLSARSVVIVGVVLLACSLVVQGRHYHDWFTLRTYSLAQSNHDVPQLIGSNAVISGEYGPALVVDGTTRTFPHFIGGYIKDELLLFARYPVTHVAVGAPGWRYLAEQIPLLNKARVVTKFWIRDTEIWLVRVTELFGNKIAAEYELTDFENALEFGYAGQLDSAHTYLERFLAQHPDNLSALTENYYLNVASVTLSDLRPLIERLVELGSTDYPTLTRVAIYYRWLDKDHPSETSRRLSEEYLAKAKKHSPLNRDLIQTMYENFPPSARILN